MYYLGMDGGGTKTAFVLINEKGNIIATNFTTGSYYLEIGFDAFYEVIHNGLNEILKKSNLALNDIKYSFLGVPGLDEKLEDMPHIKQIVKRIFPINKYRCGNDAEVCWAGSLACQPGINLVGGTGAIGFGKDRKGNTCRASGWGEFCGDEGSAFWLGRQLISLFAKQADGREEKTAIYDIIQREFNLKRDLDFITVVYDVLERKRDKIAGLAVLLYQAVKKGDKKAAELYKKAAYEHSLTVRALVKKLNFAEDEEILVSYSGGVFKAGSYVLKPLGEYIKVHLAGRDIKLIEPVLQPVTGAALYALLLHNNNNNKLIVDKLKKEEERIGLR